MRLLAIETAVPPGSVAVVDTKQGEPAIEHALPLGDRAARSLLPAIDSVMGVAGWAPRSLDVVAACVGPGSFTGLRIGVTAAKSLAYAAGARCVALGTLAIIADQASAGSRSGAGGWAVLDAQRGEVFAARLESPNRVRVMPQADWLAMLQAGELLAGPVLQRLRDALPDGVILAEPVAWRPQAATLARLAAETAPCDPFALVPAYHRLSAAEEKLQNHSGSA